MRDYRAASQGHRGAGGLTEDGIRGTINVEADRRHAVMRQHYHEVSAKPTRVEMLSAADPRTTCST